MYNEEPLAASITHFFHNLPRFYFHHNESKTFDPESEDYYESVAMFAFPFVFFGFFLVVVLLLIACCQYRKKISEKRAKKRSLLLPRVFLIGFLFFAALMGVIGILSSYGMGEEVRVSVEVFEATESKMLNDVDEVLTIVRGLNETQYLTPEIKNGIKWLNFTDEETQKYKADVIESTKEGQYGLISFFGLIILFCIIGSIGGFAVVKGIILLIIICGLILLPLTWFVVGGVTSSMVFISDGCPSIETYVESKVSNDTKVWIDYYIYCQGQSPFSSFITDTQANLLKAQLELAYVTSHNVPNKEAVIEALRALISELSTLETKLQELNNCTVVQKSWNTLRANVCTTFLDALAGAFFAGSIIGLALFGAIWTSIKFLSIMRSLHLSKKGYHILASSSYDSSSDKESIELPQNSTAVALLIQ